MAIDEILMDTQKRAGALPCLRFYQWDRPAVTCGYFQSVQDVARRFPGMEVVRRLTGGGLVVHGEDLTFSLTLPDAHPFFRGNVKDSYLKVSEALRKGLKPVVPEIEYADCRNVLSPRGRGERVCFDQPACYDLLTGSKKVAGSSQRHTDGAVLYQSSLFLPGSFSASIEAILKGFGQEWKAEFREEALSREEIAAAEKKSAERYASPDWRFLPASFLSKQSGQL